MDERCSLYLDGQDMKCGTSKTCQVVYFYGIYYDQLLFPSRFVNGHTGMKASYIDHPFFVVIR